ncbi:hypothetical protein ACHAXR_009832 [Thalassiosira sp. AJA248-18]
MIHRMKQRRTVALAMLSIAAALCIGGLLQWNAAEDTAFDLEGMEYDEYDEQFHRYLLKTFDESHLMEEYDAAPSDEETAQEDQVTKNKTMEPYTLEDAILEAGVFKFSFAVIIYDPENDKFLGYYCKHQRIAASFQKLKSSIKDLAFMLRKSFPERFTPSSPEFAVAIKAGDYPHILYPDMIPHVGVAPVLQFGSVFRDVNLYPNMIAMPMPGLYLKCFSEWSYKHSICTGLRPLRKRPKGELAFGEELGLEWDNLIPQLVWRGTDFAFLPLLVHPKPFSPFALPTISQKLKVASKETDQLRRMVATSEALRESYDKLLPRWKGVSLTADAELAAKDEDELPWANIKFANYNDSGLKATLGSDRYKLYEEAGIAVSDYMSPKTQAKYKYHIDIGGGGGTTWTGTTTKLAMPGLLFHHVTPTKDFIHDRLKPYEHFVPVSPDLSDLKDKFDWAESHPEEAKRIADQATKFMRHLGTPEGFEQMFEEDFVQPLRRVIEAYQPTSTILPSELSSRVGSLKGKTWMDVLQSPEGSHMERLLECNGFTTLQSSCEVVGEKAARFANKK